MEQLNLNLTAPLNTLGYGVVSWNILKALDDDNVRVSLWELGIVDSLHGTADETELFRRCASNRQYFSPYAPSLRIYHQNDMAQHVGKGLRCGLPFFELNHFYDYERLHLGYLDKILVPSLWAKEIIEREIPFFNSEDIHVVRMGVDRDIFNNDRVTTRPPENTTVFLNMGKWEIRKGHDILCDAFNDAFEKDDDVNLVMACSNPFLSAAQSKEWVDLYKESKLGDKIVITDRLDHHQHVASLMGTAHCGVFPSRAEGWNMEALEMMSMGKHIIITDYSAHTEFCNPRNSKIIPVQTVEPAFDDIWFKGKETDRGVVPEWAYIGDIQYEALVQHMRDIHRSRSDGILEVNESGIKTAERLTWARTVKEILSALDLEN